jgi:hypothetical protein
VNPGRTEAPARTNSPGRSGAVQDHRAEGVGFGKHPGQRRCWQQRWQQRRDPGAWRARPRHASVSDPGRSRSLRMTVGGLGPTGRPRIPPGAARAIARGGACGGPAALCGVSSSWSVRRSRRPSRHRHSCPVSISMHSRRIGNGGMLLWNFTVLGDAAAQLDAEAKEQFPEIPWAQPARLRNRIVHGSWRVETAEDADALAEAPAVGRAQGDVAVGDAADPPAAAPAPFERTHTVSRPSCSRRRWWRGGQADGPSPRRSSTRRRVRRARW